MSSSSSRDKKPAKLSTSGAGRIRTLSDLNRPTGSDSDSDSDAPQEYYTGGQKSGMLVQDPTKNNEVDAIFAQARQFCAVQGPIENVPPSSTSKTFSGTGRLLSGESVTSDSTPQQPASIVHNIVFWRNGFTVNDGPLRRLDDPENASFLESIRKSKCPTELEPANRLNLIKTEENCPEPEDSDLEMWVRSLNPEEFSDIDDLLVVKQKLELAKEMLLKRQTKID